MGLDDLRPPQPGVPGPASLPRKVLHGPASPNHTRWSFAVRAVLAAFLTIPYIVLGWLGGCPGVGFRFSCWRMALSGLFGRDRLPLSKIVALIAGPLDSVRYFEFSFVQACLAGVPIREFLDVSSPRLLPLQMLRRDPERRAVLLNPDASDLQATEAMVRALGLKEQCRTEGRLIAESGLGDASFDLITSISVVEHIPDDSGALASMWRLLKPGGRLVLTVPCSAKPYEEWADFNKYGLLKEAADGLIFWQRFYSPSCLESRVFSVLGKPVRQEVYGEKSPGNYDRNVQAKMRNPFYPVWREPWMMAREWRRFERIEDLTGMGVVGMMFVKDSHQ